MTDSSGDDQMPGLVGDSTGDEGSDGERARGRKSAARKKRQPPEAAASASGPAASSGMRKGFLDKDATSTSAANPGEDDDLSTLKIGELKAIIAEAGLSLDGCIDKADIVERARQARVTTARLAAGDASRKRREEEQAKQAKLAEQEKARKEAEARAKEEAKRVADMAKALHALTPPKNRDAIERARSQLAKAHGLLQTAEHQQLRDAVRYAERTLEAGQAAVAVSEQRERAAREADERRSEVEDKLTAVAKALRKAGGSSSVERHEHDLKALVEHFEESVDPSCATPRWVPPVAAAKLELAYAQTRREQAACTRAEAEVEKMRVEAEKLREELEKQRKRAAKKDEENDAMRKELRSEARQAKKDRTERALAEAEELRATNAQLMELLDGSRRENEALQERIRQRPPTQPQPSATGLAAASALSVAPAEPEEKPSECPVCFEPRDGAAMSSDDVGKAVSIQGDTLMVDGCEREIAWDGARHADMTGVIVSAQCKFKGRVEVLVSDVVLSFEVPRLLADDGSGPMRPTCFAECSASAPWPRTRCRARPRAAADTFPTLPVFAVCVLHEHCIRQYRDAGNKKCPVCQTFPENLRSAPFR